MQWLVVLERRGGEYVVVGIGEMRHVRSGEQFQLDRRSGKGKERLCLLTLSYTCTVKQTFYFLLHLIN